VASGFGYLFGMPLMFFLAGAATWLAVERRGIGGHAGLRLRRLLIPLVLGLVILGPPQAWVSYVAKGGEAGPLEFLATYVATLNPTLNPRWFGDVGHHLWFLAFLFLYVLVTLPLLSWLRERREQGRDLLIGRVAEGRFGLLWLVLPIAALQLVLRPLFPEYRDWADFVLWLGYFVIGIGAMADSRVMPAILGRRRITLWIAPVVIVAYLPVVLSGSPVAIENSPGASLGGLAYIGWRTALAWVMTLVWVGFAATYFTARPRFLGWASAMVLPFYVLHHPVTVVVAALVVPLSLGLYLKFGLIVLIAGAATVGLCLALDLATAALGTRLRSPESLPRPTGEPAAESPP
ncbi:MAG TPA: acyltransferase family protein, partial [Candidatus Limnocylindria bacterium]|nr:acyltransferase family protein [Candidatus Limnocylindria bacterium]